MKRKLQRLRQIRPRELAGLLLLLPAAVCAFFLRRQNPYIWLILERGDEMSDNGIAFFEYCMKERRDRQCYYVARRNGAACERLKEYGENVIEFGSFRHWVFFLACEANISSQLNNAPSDLCAALFRKLHINSHKIIYLQNGNYFSASVMSEENADGFRMLLCGAKPEYEFVSRSGEYPSSHLACVGGQCRFDSLYSSVPDRYVLIAPAWRDWLNTGEDPDGEAHRQAFTATDYYRCWNAFLSDPMLEKTAEDYDIRFVFYLPPALARYADCFRGSPNVIIADSTYWDHRKLVSRSMALVTDYAGEFMDFAYMKRPVFFYQFDEQQFREDQGCIGYFSYRSTGFGKWYREAGPLLSSIRMSAAEDFRPDKTLLDEHSRFFPVYDNRNCSRTYELIAAAVR